MDPGGPFQSGWHSSYQDSRTRTIRQPRNLGLLPALNTGFHASPGEDLAWISNLGMLVYNAVLSRDPAACWGILRGLSRGDLGPDHSG